MRINGSKKTRDLERFSNFNFSELPSNTIDNSNFKDFKESNEYITYAETEIISQDDLSAITHARESKKIRS